ncbi:hypothetical protein HNQ59_003951 [Chitinivorax tropicus]|uniref:Uncharacterized protein n=1 Tax=Chitinivorax tropicus TaxID=714531 RepID=A0A840MWC6_9PROT|nr:hypothetical protein [Chitinivorax tropicus]MBB5020626.1 hypothetical protein [Chitinivorax tropicus]
MKSNESLIGAISRLKKMEKGPSFYDFSAIKYMSLGKDVYLADIERRETNSDYGLAWRDFKLVLAKLSSFSSAIHDQKSLEQILSTSLFASGLLVDYIDDKSPLVGFTASKELLKHLILCSTYIGGNFPTMHVRSVLSILFHYSKMAGVDFNEIAADVIEERDRSGPPHGVLYQKVLRDFDPIDIEHLH